MPQAMNAAKAMKIAKKPAAPAPAMKGMKSMKARCFFCKETLLVFCVFALPVCLLACFTGRRVACDPACLPVCSCPLLPVRRRVACDPVLLTALRVHIACLLACFLYLPGGGSHANQIVFVCALTSLLPAQQRVACDPAILILLCVVALPACLLARDHCLLACDPNCLPVGPPLPCLRASYCVASRIACLLVCLICQAAGRMRVVSHVSSFFVLMSFSPPCLRVPLCFLPGGGLPA